MQQQEEGQASPEDEAVEAGGQTAERHPHAHEVEDLERPFRLRDGIAEIEGRQRHEQEITWLHNAYPIMR